MELPDVKNYLPTENGDPPLGNAQNWGWDTEKTVLFQNQKLMKKVFRIELNTMPGWAGSSWYFNRYMDPIMIKVLLLKMLLNIGKKLIYILVEVSMQQVIYCILDFGKCFCMI